MFLVPAAGCIFPEPEPWLPGLDIGCSGFGSSVECVDKQALADNPWLADAVCDLICTEVDCPGSFPAPVDSWEQCTPGRDWLHDVLVEGIGPELGRWQCKTFTQVAIGVDGVFDPMLNEWYPFPVDEPAGAVEVCANGVTEATEACAIACEDEVHQWSAVYLDDLLFRRVLSQEQIPREMACRPLKLPEPVGTCVPFIPGVADAVMSQGDSVEVLEASGDYTVAPGDAALRPIALHGLTLKRGVITVQTRLGPVVAEDLVVRLARPALGKVIDGRAVILPASSVELFLAARLVNEDEDARQSSAYDAYSGVLEGDVHGELTDQGLVLHLDELAYLPGLRLDVRIAPPGRISNVSSPR